MWRDFSHETLPALDTERFALIRLDSDMYEPTYVALECLYPKLAIGGFTIIDDYGAVPQCPEESRTFEGK